LKKLLLTTTENDKRQTQIVHHNRNEYTRRCSVLIMNGCYGNLFKQYFEGNIAQKQNFLVREYSINFLVRLEQFLSFSFSPWHWVYTLLHLFSMHHVLINIHYYANEAYLYSSYYNTLIFMRMETHQYLF